MGTMPFTLDLGPYGAPGFELRERLDFSGHGRLDPVLPHVNTEVIDAGGITLHRDLCCNQLPGMNFSFRR